MLKEKLSQVHEVEIRGDKTVCDILPEAVSAMEADYGTEYQTENHSGNRRREPDACHR